MTEFLALAITIFSLGIASIIAFRFRIPPLILFLFMGMVIGAYGYLQSNTTVTFLGDLGSALLMFAIGTEFSIYKLFSRGFLKEARVALIEFTFTFVALYLILSIWLAFSIALLMALALSITSTGVSLKLLQELDMSKKLDMPLIIKISVIEDLITVFAFTLISAFSVSAGKPLDSIVVSFLSSIILFIFAYYAFSIFINRFLFRFNIKEEDLLMLALGLLLLIVSISTILGLSTAFGAYISGSIVSSWKDRWKTLDKDLKNFSYLFICFFFLTVGLSVDLSNLDFLLLLALIPIALIVKFAGMFLGSYSTYGSSRWAFFIAIGMLSRGELSLIIIGAAVTAGFLPSEYLGIMAFVVFFSIIASFFLLRESAEIYTYLRIRFPRIKGIAP